MVTPPLENSIENAVLVGSRGGGVSIYIYMYIYIYIILFYIIILLYYYIIILLYILYYYINIYIYIILLYILYYYTIIYIIILLYILYIYYTIILSHPYTWPFQPGQAPTPPTLGPLGRREGEAWVHGRVSSWATWGPALSTDGRACIDNIYPYR